MMLNGERKNRGERRTRVGSDGTATFLHLLGKGVISPKDRPVAEFPLAFPLKSMPQTSTLLKQE
jgi:hypothetical protein